MTAKQVERDEQIMAMVAQGHKPAAIMLAMGLSRNTGRRGAMAGTRGA